MVILIDGSPLPLTRPVAAMIAMLLDNMDSITKQGSGCVQLHYGPAAPMSLKLLKTTYSTNKIANDVLTKGL